MIAQHRWITTSFVFYCLLLAIACNSLENGNGQQWITATFNVDNSVHPTSPNDISKNIETSSIHLSVIYAVAESTSVDVSGYVSVPSYFDRQKQNLIDNTVTMTLPVNTRMKLVKINYHGISGISEIDGTTLMTHAGVSDVFAIDPGESGKTVRIPLQRVSIKFSMEGVEWAAHRVGADGEWTVDASSDGTIRFNTDSSGKYSIAYKCKYREFLHNKYWEDFYIKHYTWKETNSPRTRCIGSNVIRGTISNRQPENFQVSIGVGSYESTVASDNSASFEIRTGSGSKDLAVVEGGWETSSTNPLRVLIKRDMEIKSDMTIDLDMSDAIETKTRIFAGNDASSLSGKVELITKNFTRIRLGYLHPETPYHYLPDSGIIDGDLYRFKARNNQEWRTSTKEIKIFSKDENIPANAIDFDVIAVFSGAAISGKTTPRFEPIFYTKSSASPDVKYYKLELESQELYNDDSSPPSIVSWFVEISKGWLGSATSYQVPDFSLLSGWNDKWTLASQGTIFAKFGPVMQTADIDELPFQPGYVTHYAPQNFSWEPAAHSSTSD